MWLKRVEHDWATFTHSVLCLLPNRYPTVTVGHIKEYDISFKNRALNEMGLVISLLSLLHTDTYTHTHKSQRHREKSNLEVSRGNIPKDWGWLYILCGGSMGKFKLHFSNFPCFLIYNIDTYFLIYISLISNPLFFHVIFFNTNFFKIGRSHSWWEERMLFKKCPDTPF